MDYDIKFKKACEKGALKDMLECQMEWGEQQLRLDPNFDANYILAQSILYAYNFILTRQPEFYERMLNFYENGKNTQTYKPQNPGLYDWYKSEAEKMISKVKEIK